MKNLKFSFKLTSYIIFTILISCNKKVHKQNLSFIICNKNINNNDRIKIKAFNNGDKDYFIIIDTINYYDLNQNYKINESSRPKQIFFLEDDSIPINIYSNSDKQIFLDSINVECNKTKKLQSLSFINKFKKLENIIILKKKSIVNFSIPFSVNYTICNNRFKYDLDITKHYTMMLKYGMKKSVIEKLVYKEKIQEFEDKGIFAYYGEITSDKVPLVLAK